MTKVITYAQSGPIKTFQFGAHLQVQAPAGYANVESYIYVLASWVVQARADVAANKRRAKLLDSAGVITRNTAKLAEMGLTVEQALAIAVPQ